MKLTASLFAGAGVGFVALLAPCLVAAAGPDAPWLLGRAYKVPSEYSNQESGYFSLVAGTDGTVYVGTAKYGVGAYLLAFDPKAGTFRMVIDARAVIGTKATGFAAQSKFHTRNNVGPSGKIYLGTKQGYPEKGERPTDYPGGYVFIYDPKTGVTDHFEPPIKHHGIISVAPDESRGLVYLSTCSDDRPVDHTHFMILDVNKRSYRDLGDLEHPYAFVVLDDRGRAYHPVRGGTVARYDPAADRLEKRAVTVNGKPAPAAVTKDGAILNWEVSPDRKTLYSVEMSTNALYRFDLTASGATIPGTLLGPLLPDAKATDCRAMNVGPDGTVWAAVTEQGLPEGPQLHLVSYRPGTAAPRDHGRVGVANPDYVTLADAAGKPKPWHHTLRKSKDGVLTPWQPMGVCATADGTVYIMTIAPFTLLRFGPFR